MILISKQSIFYVVKYQCKLYRTNAYVHVNQYMLFWNNTALMSWKTIATSDRIRLVDMNMHVYLGHFNSLVKCIESHSRSRYRRAILKSMKRQIGYSSNTYPLLIYFKSCQDVLKFHLMNFLNISLYVIKCHLKILYSTSRKAAIKMNYSLCHIAQPWN